MKKLIFIWCCLFFASPGLQAQKQTVYKQSIEKDWMFRQNNIGIWRTAMVPGTVHTDLMEHQLIKDPFYRTNEKEVQWIDKINWEYSVKFYPEDELFQNSHQQLVFYGLDTYADIFLNGELLGSTNNMFRTWKFDVKDLLKAGENTLNIKFYSPITKSLEAMEAYGLALPTDNDYSQYGGMGNIKVSVYTRKAPYHYGWDWGPRLVPSGIWRPVVLEGWNDLKIDDIFIKQPAVDKSLAKLEAEVTFQSDLHSEVRVELLHDKKILTHTTLNAREGSNRVNLPFSIKNPRLWWSNGLGQPHLYDFEIRIKAGKEILASERITTGLRSLKLVRNKDEIGETFYFELNGTPVFAKGTNSIPNDIFLPRITRSDYEKMVKDVAMANMNMIRIWGGGIYEDDYFYELCDRHGIMVWQDFMFACAMYPDNKEFLDNVREEAIDNIKRLRNHPCIALWCGNNEIDVAWARWGWKRRYNPEEQEQITNAYIKLAHKLLPELVEEYTDGDDYWPSSPMSGPEPGAHELRPATSGDNHYWGVWFEQHKFEQFEDHIGRFISEYGFQSFPLFNTVIKYAIPEDFDIESEVMMAHQRSGIGNQRIREYMSWYYDVPEDFAQFLYLSQVLQARAMKAALHAHRRNMPYCMGSLMWQLNDCWPVASWSTIDYYRNWKAAHYATKEACKPVIAAPKLTEEQLELWAINDKLSSIKSNYKIDLKAFNGKTLKTIEGKHVINANSSVLIDKINLATILDGHEKSEVMAVITLYQDNTVLDEQVLYFTEPKHLNLPKNPLISMELMYTKGKRYLQVSTDKLARDVMFHIPNGTLFLDRNFIDLLPGKIYRLEVLQSSELSNADPIHIRYSNQIYNLL